MADYCLPPDLANAFLGKLKDGTITPGKLMDMTSSERRKLFSDVIGDDHAENVNALFEGKMLLKDQQRGMVTWAKQVAGISEARRQDILTRIEKLDRVLNPTEERKFLADLAARKLGVTVTADEAKEISDLAQKAKVAKAVREQGWTPETGTAYGRAVLDLRDKIESLKPSHRTWTELAIDAANAPKTLLTGFLHASAPFVQNWGMLTIDRSWEAFGQMFRYFANEENYRNLTAYIIGHPYYQLAVDGKLGITKLGDKLSLREEQIQSSLVEQANKYLSDKTGVPNVIRASSRAFTGYLNYVRFNRFADLIDAAKLNGEDVSAGSQTVRDLAKVVNDFTGRGALGVGDKAAGSELAQVLNATFFAPRKISATIQMFNPKRYLDPNVSATARQAAIRQMAGSLIATGALLGIARATGARVDFDPRSSDFAKININGEKLDMTGGNSIYARLLARLASRQEIDTRERLRQLGEGRNPTRADLIAQYTRGKLAPTGAFLADFLYGKDAVGNPFSLTSEAREHLIPIVVKNFLDYAQNNPGDVAAFLPALSSIFGVELESPLPMIGGRTRNIWGEKFTDEDHTGTDPVETALGKIGYSPGYAPRKIRGVTLSPEQYDYYQQVSGRLIKRAISRVVGTQGFDRLPPGVQEQVLRKAATHARDMGTDRTLMKYSHDIIPKAIQVKRDNLRLGSEAARANRAVQ